MVQTFSAVDSRSTQAGTTSIPVLLSNESIIPEPAGLSRTFGVARKRHTTWPPVFRGTCKNLEVLTGFLEIRWPGSVCNRHTDWSSIGCKPPWFWYNPSILNEQRKQNAKPTDCSTIDSNPASTA